MLDKVIEKPKFEPIPVWKWILLFFCPVHIGYDEEGDIVCVSFNKMLFNHLYVMQLDYWSKATSNLLRTSKLTRKG